MTYLLPNKTAAVVINRMADVAQSLEQSSLGLAMLPADGLFNRTRRLNEAQIEEMTHYLHGLAVTLANTTSTLLAAIDRQPEPHPTLIIDAEFREITP